MTFFLETSGLNPGHLAGRHLADGRLAGDFFGG